LTLGSLEVGIAARRMAVFPSGEMFVIQIQLHKDIGSGWRFLGF
jgi:hypothetical protein